MPRDLGGAEGWRRNILSCGLDYLTTKDAVPRAHTFLLIEGKATLESSTFLFS